jgi:hypothetical protein
MRMEPKPRKVEQQHTDGISDFDGFQDRDILRQINYKLRDCIKCVSTFFRLSSSCLVVFRLLRVPRAMCSVRRLVVQVQVLHCLSLGPPQAATAKNTVDLRFVKSCSFLPPSATPSFSPRLRHTTAFKLAFAG